MIAFLIIEAEFVNSAAAAGDLPREGVPELAMVGRSNVGKSSLINALVRQKVARTSAAPGKTRLANIYRVAGPPDRSTWWICPATATPVAVHARPASSKSWRGSSLGNLGNLGRLGG